MNFGHVLEEFSVFKRFLAATIEEYWKEFGRDDGHVIAERIRASGPKYPMSDIGDSLERIFLVMALEHKGFTNIVDHQCLASKTAWDLYAHLCETYNVEPHFR